MADKVIQLTAGSYSSDGVVILKTNKDRPMKKVKYHGLYILEWQTTLKN